MNAKVSFEIGLTTLLMLGGGHWTSAAIVSQSFNVSQTIGDADGIGISNSRTVNPFGVGSKIASLQVSLNIEGGYNSDYFVSLRHETSGGTGYSVLLNRVGIVSATDSSDYGYLDPGMNVVLSDKAAYNIHEYGLTATLDNGVLTGTWQPDGRSIDPSAVTSATRPTAMLSSFQGLDPNGTWTLFILDQSPGGTGTLTSWGLTIDTGMVAVPEPSTALAGAFMLLLTLTRFQWRSGKQ